ncbi:Methyl farnesoate epoxidase [Orchesella cincta]|uniref:Methyl farnesoate epoxidase n=1 Tax=Orchesella cincta TaxID=48709 RepID=A0A1D2M2E7_ORCCI|nr:Methyl farnesoate epoxidase [Orchesella cincta]
MSELQSVYSFFTIIRNLQILFMKTHQSVRSRRCNQASISFCVPHQFANYIVKMLDIANTILVGLLLLLLIVFLNENFLKARKNLAPGPLCFPFLGNLIQIAWINSKEPHLAFSRLAEVYGNIFSFQMGSVYSVVINSFELMEEYLHKPEFSDRYFNAWLAERTWHKRLGIIFAKYPEPWHQLRRFSLRSLKDFGLGKRSRMHSNIHDELFDIVSELKRSVKETNGIHSFDDYFTVSALNVVWSLLAGRRYEHSDPTLLRLTKMFKDSLESCNFGNSLPFAFPEWRNWFPDWTGMSTQRRCAKETNTFFQEFVDKRKMLGVYKIRPENLVDEFLYEIDKQMEELGADDENVFTEQQLIIVMSDFFIAGSETTSNTLAWCILHLLRNPKVQEKLQNEIDSLVPKETLLDVEHESKLHYVRATLAETHRMASIFPMMVPRAVTKDTFCGKFLIPKGTYVIGNLHAIHHERSYWKDPDNFRPERFLDESGKFRSDPRLKPFGFGKRACLGEPIAAMTLIHYLATLMQNFTFLPVPSQPLPTLSPIIGVTSAPRKFQALVKCR